MKEYSTNSARGLKLFLKSGRVVQVYPVDLKGYENGETPVGSDRAPHPIEHLSDNGSPLYRAGHKHLRMRSQTGMSEAFHYLMDNPSRDRSSDGWKATTKSIHILAFKQDLKES